MNEIYYALLRKGRYNFYKKNSQGRNIILGEDDIDFCFQFDDRFPRGDRGFSTSLFIDKGILAYEFYDPTRRGFRARSADELVNIAIQKGADVAAAVNEFSSGRFVLAKVNHTDLDKIIREQAMDFKSYFASRGLYSEQLF